MRILPTYSISLCLCLLSIISSSDSECGKSGSCEQGYVFGGLDTCRDEFPWNVALVESSTILINDEIQIFCGASIITPIFLISAGHCFKYRKGEIDRRKENVRAYIGLDNRVEPNYGSDYKLIESVDIYPDWLKTDRFAEGHDLAIIKVETPIEYSTIISPICLPSVEQGNLVQVGTSVKMAGFGSTASSKISGPQNLLKGHFKIVDCGEPNNICAAETEDGKVIRDTCNGDSGGGLVAEENGSHILVGVVSWGRRCGDSNFTTRYVNVLDHLPWIKTKIEVCFTVTGSKCILPFRFQRNRYDECISSLPSRPGKTIAAKCPTRLDSKGQGDDFEYCNQKCPGFKKQVDGEFQSWSSWSRCSGRCQSGVATRYRNCSTPQYGGHSCDGDYTEEEQCNKRKECEILTTTATTTTDIDSVTSIAQTSRKCSDTETCETRENCPYIKDKYAELQAEKRLTKQRKGLIVHLRSKICNKEKKGFCCPPGFPQASRLNDVGRDITKIRDKQAMPEAMADFTQAFYTHMANKSEGKNFAFSPVILHAALATLYMGATPESNTERELGTSLYGLNRRDTLKEEYRRLIDFYRGDPSFYYGSRIWTKKNVQIKQNYTNQVLKNNGATSETTEFGTGEAVDKVNKWVNKLSNGVIKDLVSEFDPDTKMFLANAIYFKEDWQVDFSETDLLNDKRLDSEPFFILGEEYSAEEVRVEMMEQIATSDTYRYGEVDMIDSPPSRVVTIPYKNPNFEMQIILPGTNVSNGLAILEDQMRRGTEKLQDQDYIRKTPLDPFNLFNSDKYQYKKPIDDIGIKMPKFRISHKFNINQKLDVSDILKDMGVNQIFQAAELSHMTDAGQLTVSKVLHKAVIDVKHTGTTPAAATGIERVRPSASFGERIRVDVNQPFIFIIQDTRNKIPIMVGRVMDPRQTM